MHSLLIIIIIYLNLQLICKIINGECMCTLYSTCMSLYNFIACITCIFPVCLSDMVAVILQIYICTVQECESLSLIIKRQSHIIMLVVVIA